MGSRRGRERKWGGGNRRQNEEVGQVGGKNETKEIVGSECFDKKQINSEKMQPTLSVHCTHTHTHTHTHMHTHTRMHTHTLSSTESRSSGSYDSPNTDLRREFMASRYDCGGGSQSSSSLSTEHEHSHYYWFM